MATAWSVTQITNCPASAILPTILKQIDTDNTIKPMPWSMRHQVEVACKAAEMLARACGQATEPVVNVTISGAHTTGHTSADGITVAVVKST